jgi:hypothetical protein
METKARIVRPSGSSLFWNVKIAARDCSESKILECLETAIPNP